MIITDKFVLLKYPKTGSKFAREVLLKVHSNKKHSFFEKVLFRLNIKNRPSFRIHEAPNIREMSHKRNFMDQHGIYIQIPKEERHKKIVSIIRDVYDRYISMYEFKDWIRTPWIDENELKQQYPDYPELSFRDFLLMLFEHNPIQDLPEVNKKLSIGPATSQFILFFFKDPFKILNEIDEEYINSDRFKNDIADISFLNQNNLNQELYEFLTANGYNKNEVQFILNEQKMNTSRPEGKNKDDYFSEELYDMVHKKDKLLFKILEHI